ncbi:MAG: EAL domain-containing protein [Magnetococcales bacterium]|nr:EAL domain-containing protein [Magnetococcales bacterium]
MAGPPPLFYVVDDDAVTRLMLSRFLRQLGYEVVELTDGSGFLRALDERRPDVVLMDAKMPVMNGFDACASMKKQPEMEHIPVLMITGLHDDESVDLAYAVGAADFITKPIHWAILRNRVRYLLRAIEAERQLHLAAGVFENTNEGIVVTNPEAVIQSVNPAFERITGYSEREALGRNMNLLRSGRHPGGFYLEMWRGLKENHRWQGEIWNRRKNGEIYPQWVNISAIRSPHGEVVNYIGVFSDLTAIKESERSLLFLSGHDILTELPNRHRFHERLEQTLVEARWQEGMVGVMHLDLDRFKLINETMGHDVGDALLVQVANRLAKPIPGIGTLGRLGGDEFGVILPKITHSDEVAHVARELLASLSQPFLADGVELFVGSSIGIGIFPLDGDSVKILMKNTDAALSHAKLLGRNNFQFYRAELNTSSMARMLLETSMRNALERNEFCLHYQPQISLQTGKLVGAEALLRWIHPSNGMISPGDFIPLAEETGLIVPIGRWALETACKQAKRWEEARLPLIRIAVNLSGIQFRQPDFTDVVTHILGETGLSHHWLELELTESIAMGDMEDTMTKLTTLSDVDVRLAIDDFGTGFSSLSYLKRYPIDTLKIDQSFVRNCTTDPEDAAIVKAFINLAHSLGLSVIAEGVETEAQLRFLRDHDCDEVQGFYYSRPLTPEVFTELLESHQRQERALAATWKTGRTSQG